MARKTWQTAADWRTGIAENLEITDAGVKLARPEPAQFTRSSPAYLSDGTLVAANQPRYEGAGVRIEQGTTNLIPLAKQKFEGWTVYQGAVVTLTQDVAVPEWGAVDATRIQTSGGSSIIKYYYSIEMPPAGAMRSEQVWVKNIGNDSVRVSSNVGRIKDTVLPGESRLVKLEKIIGTGTESLQIEFYATDAANSLDFIAWRPQAEAKAYCTSWTDSTRAPETLSVPGLPTVEGEIEVTVDVTDKCKRQVAGEIPILIYIERSIGGWGLAVLHTATSALFCLETRNDAGETSMIYFSDSLIPNGLRHLRIKITSDFVTLYCDGAPIAQIGGGTPETKPKLPSAWGRIYLGSSATGTNHADASFGNLRMVVA